MRNGVEGLLEERLIDLTARFADDADIDLLENTPAAALGSCRKKLPDPDADPAFFEKLIGIFKKCEIYNEESATSHSHSGKHRYNK
jgi:6-phosphofructokinase 1